MCGPLTRKADSEGDIMDNGITEKISEKKQIILAREKTFANALGAAVLEKPKLSVWMILIPIILVYYMMRFQRYSDSRKDFSENYMISRNRALDAAAEMAGTGKKPDPAELSRLSDVPESARGKHAEFTRVLIEHYGLLLEAEGDDYGALVRSAYGEGTNYLLFLNLLNKAERRMNKALRPHLADSVEGFDEIVQRMEAQSERLRREHAGLIFPSR